MTEIHCRVIKCIYNKEKICNESYVDIDENTHCWSMRTHKKVQSFGGNMG